MQLPVGIHIQATASGAINTIHGVGNALTQMSQRPMQAVQHGFMRVQQTGVEATRVIQNGMSEAQGAWYKLGAALGVPVSLAGVLGAVSGLRTLKQAFFEANAEIANAETMMSARMRRWNESFSDAESKSKRVVDWIVDYGASTPFEATTLVKSASVLSQVTKTEKGMKDAVKTAGWLAALNNSTDTEHASNALVGAFNGDWSSMKWTYNIAGSEERLKQIIIANQGKKDWDMGFTADNKWRAIQYMVEQQAGGPGGGDRLVRKLSEQLPGAISNLKDNFAVPVQKATRAGFDEFVKGLVDLNDALERFRNSPMGLSFIEKFSARYKALMHEVGNGMRFVGDNIARLPALYERYQPLVTQWLKWGGIILGVNVAALAVKGTLGGIVMIAQTGARLLLPFMALVTNPLLTLAILALGQAFYPLARGVEVGGKSVDGWLVRMAKASRDTNWKDMFLGPLRAIRTVIDQLRAGTFDPAAFWNSFLDPTSFVGRIAAIVRPVGEGLRDALFTAFPEARPLIEGVTRAMSEMRAAGLSLAATLMDRARPVLTWLGGWVREHGPLLLKIGGGVLLLNGALGALGLIGRVLAPILAPVMAAARGIGGALGVMASPAILAGVTVLGAAFYPMIRDLNVGEKSLDGWLVRLAEISRARDWKSTFSGMLDAVRSALSGSMDAAGRFDSVRFWRTVFAPDSLFGRIKDIVAPVVKGLFAAIEESFPASKGFFTEKLPMILDNVARAVKVLWDALKPFASGFGKGVMEVFNGIGSVLGKLMGFKWDKNDAAGNLESIGKWVNSAQGKQTLESLGRMAAHLTAAGLGAAALGKMPGGGALMSNPYVGLGMAAITVGYLAVTAMNMSLDNKQSDLLRKNLYLYPGGYVTADAKKESNFTPGGGGPTQTAKAVNDAYSGKIGKGNQQGMETMLGSMVFTFGGRSGAVDKLVTNTQQGENFLVRGNIERSSKAGTFFAQELMGINAEQYRGKNWEAFSAASAIQKGIQQIAKLDALISQGRGGRKEREQIATLMSSILRHRAVLGNLGVMADVSGANEAPYTSDFRAQQATAASAARDAAQQGALAGAPDAPNGAPNDGKLYVKDPSRNVWMAAQWRWAGDRWVPAPLNMPGSGIRTAAKPNWKPGPGGKKIPLSTSSRVVISAAPGLGADGEVNGGGGGAAYDTSGSEPYAAGAGVTPFPVLVGSGGGANVTVTVTSPVTVYANEVAQLDEARVAELVGRVVKPVVTQQLSKALHG